MHVFILFPSGASHSLYFLLFFKRLGPQHRSEMLFLIRQGKRLTRPIGLKLNKPHPASSVVLGKVSSRFRHPSSA